MKVRSGLDSEGMALGCKLGTSEGRVVAIPLVGTIDVPRYLTGELEVPMVGRLVGCLNGLMDGDSVGIGVFLSSLCVGAGVVPDCALPNIATILSNLSFLSSRDVGLPQSWQPEQ